MRFALPLTVCALLALAPAAEAATVSVEGDALRVVAGPGEANALSLGSADARLTDSDQGAPDSLAAGLRPISGGGRFMRIPGQSWARVDRRILPDVLYLIRRYKVQVGEGYAPRGHDPKGEHPLGLAVDLTPGPGGGWRQVTQLARWAEPRQNHPRFPFRWVGWNGDKSHRDPKHCRPSRGYPPHLHVSWDHTPGRPCHPVRTVWFWQVRRLLTQP